MWRPAHGATTRPGPGRPGQGYGRGLGRPGPVGSAAVETVVVDDGHLDRAWVAEMTESEAEVPAPVTP
jgi:hypothetical protein